MTGPEGTTAPSAAGLPVETRERVGVVVGRRLGVSAEVMQLQPLAFGTRAMRPGATFWRAELRLDQPEPGRLAVFLKIKSDVTNPSGIAAIDEYLCSQPGLPVPRYLGAFAEENRTIRIWEFVEGRQRNFQDCAPTELTAALIAIAHLSASTTDVVSAVPTIRGPLWVQPVASALAPIFDADEALKRLAPEHARLVDAEPFLIDALHAARPRVLAHNDFKGKNIILDASDMAWVVDWDQASSAPLGASLRVLTTLGGAIEDRTVAEFARQIASAGLPTSPQDIRFVMRAQQLFWSFASGLRLGNSDLIADGLRAVDRTVESMEGSTLRP